MRQLFIRVDPHELDQYEQRTLSRRRKTPILKLQQFDLLYRALQSLPTRELLMLFSTKCLETGQEEVSSIYRVRQSNVSFRLERAFVRIRLYKLITMTCSETKLRRELVKVGLPESVVQIVMGVCKTTSQSAAAKSLDHTQGSVRHVFSTAIKKLRAELPGSDSTNLIDLVEANYNQLRAIQTQQRWKSKVGETNYV